MRFLRKEKIKARWLDVFRKSPKRVVPAALLVAAFLFAIGCRSAKDTHTASILFLRIPPAQAGGPELLGQISGRVVNGKPGARIVLYAHSQTLWWVQPFRAHQYTQLASDGSWENKTHLGAEYAALLVTKLSAAGESIRFTCGERQRAGSCDDKGFSRTIARPQDHSLQRV